jgi:peroxiredoxin
MLLQRQLPLVAITSLLALLPGALVARAGEASPSLGKKITGFTLTDPREQKPVSLADFRDKKAVVLLFLGTECPISNNCLLRVVELYKAYAPQGVQFLAVYANPQDKAERVAAHARKYELPFPVLRDDQQIVADLFAARRELMKPLAGCESSVSGKLNGSADSPAPARPRKIAQNRSRAISALSDR